MLNRLIIDVVESICVNTDPKTYEEIRKVVPKLNENARVERVRYQLLTINTNTFEIQSKYNDIDHNCYDKPALIMGCYHYWRKDGAFFRKNNLPVIVCIDFREIESNNDDYPIKIDRIGNQVWKYSTEYFRRISCYIDYKWLRLL